MENTDTRGHGRGHGHGHGHGHRHKRCIACLQGKRAVASRRFSSIGRPNATEGHVFVREQ